MRTGQGACPPENGTNDNHISNARRVPAQPGIERATPRFFQPLRALAFRKAVVVRIRTIKPEFFLHSDLWELELEVQAPVRLAFVGLWCAADRRGRFKWRPRELKLQILPYDNCDFSRVLDALTTRGFLVRYASNGQEYGFIPSFERHQVVNNRERDSELPDPCDPTTSTRATRVPHACPTRHDLDQGEGKGREWNMEGKENTMSDTHPASEPCGALAPPCSTELPLALTAEPPIQASPIQAPSAPLQLSPPSPTVKTPPAPRTDRYEAAREVLAFLNSEAGRVFEAVPVNLNLIRDRIREALDDVEGVKAMVRRQVKLWGGTHMETYLRPATLFGKLKFRGYYDDRNQPLPPQDGHTNGRVPAQKMHPDGRPRSIAMQLLREVEAEAGLVPGEY